jgi:hypothetical protein
MNVEQPQSETMSRRVPVSGRGGRDWGLEIADWGFEIQMTWLTPTHSLGPRRLRIRPNRCKSVSQRELSALIGVYLRFHLTVRQLGDCRASLAMTGAGLGRASCVDAAPNKPNLAEEASALIMDEGLLIIGNWGLRDAMGAGIVWTECQTKPISAFSEPRKGVRLENKANPGGRGPRLGIADWGFDGDKCEIRDTIHEIRAYRVDRMRNKPNLPLLVTSRASLSRDPAPGVGVADARYEIPDARYASAVWTPRQTKPISWVLG